MLLTIIVFFLILGLLVLVHELGHFVVARRNGVTAEEFGFGFPPRLIGTYRDRNGKRKWVFGNKQIEEEIKDKEETIYSINAIPLGGFVKIKGEDGEDKGDPKSFAAQSIWKRFKILSAGVFMNFVLGFVLFVIAFMIGLPEVIDDADQVPGSKIQVAEIAADSPASAAGLQIGDELVMVSVAETDIQPKTIAQFQEITKQYAGSEITLKVKHPGDENIVESKVTPRLNPPEGEGALGIVLVKTAFVPHGPFESVKRAAETTYNMISAIILFLGDLLARIFTGRKVEADVAGPIGIAVLTGQVTKMGFAYILQFAAMLSLNLGVINFFPFPALDGGRVLFLLIEKIKGSPVSQKLEGIIHMAGFMFLIGVMILVTIRDFMNFDILDRIKGIF